MRVMVIVKANKGTDRPRQNNFRRRSIAKVGILDK